MAEDAETVETAMATAAAEAEVKEEVTVTHLTQLLPNIEVCVLPLAVTFLTTARREPQTT